MDCQLLGHLRGFGSNRVYCLSTFVFFRFGGTECLEKNQWFSASQIIWVWGFFLHFLRPYVPQNTITTGLYKSFSDLGLNQFLRPVITFM